jgi:acyl-coenzyme A synthetase/AMP-(fatty) acid ligase
MILRDLVTQSAQKMPDALAVKGPDTSLTYSQLDDLANRFAHALAELGVRRGDRVGIWLGKSAHAVAAMQGVLRLCAIYVPLDPLSPAVRVRTMVQDCDMRALVTTQRRGQAVLTGDLQHVACLCLDGDGPGIHWDNLLEFPNTGVQEPALADDIAYILYTSGSTGKPKGVCISNRNALAFVEWASQILGATATDRFANHAPFHFDLSVLDLYVAFHAGAATYLIRDEASYIPEHLVTFLIQEAITVWYSVPSVLILMMEQGGLLDVPSLALRAILFAGEPFPIKHLRRLYQHCASRERHEKSGPYMTGNTLPIESSGDLYPKGHRSLSVGAQFIAPVRFFNLYGPTETNVCTYYEVTHLPETSNTPVPIGKACSGDRVWAQKEDGMLAQPGEEGELMVVGPTVMVGYWGQPAYGDKPYATGDLVRCSDDGNYVYVGRRDQMVKVRGHRIELGDVEAALEDHPAIHEAAVIVTGTGLEARLVAFVVGSLGDGAIPSLLEMKRHCAERLPRYMIVDEVHTVSALPRTRNGKIDRFALPHLI